MRCEVAARIRASGMANSMANVESVMANSEPSMANTVVDRVANGNGQSTSAGGGEQPPGEILSTHRPLAPRTYKYRDAEARKAYQRELMRKRRAGKRA